MDGNAGVPTLREELHQLADELPEDATWHDVIDEALLKLAIENGLEDVRQGRVKPVEEIRRKYGLS